MNLVCERLHFTQDHSLVRCKWTRSPFMWRAGYLTENQLSGVGASVAQQRYQLGEAPWFA